MNIKQISAAVFFSIAANVAFAENNVVPTSPQGVTRQQVRDEVLRARAAGELSYSEGSYPLAPQEFESKLTREEVKAATLRAYAAGELEYSEDPYPLRIQTAPSLVTRESVKAETIRARAAGELDYDEAAYPLTRTTSTPAIVAKK